MTDSANCPYCGQPLPLLRNGVDLDHHLERMRSWCRENAIVIRYDDTINERGAAALLDRSANTLRFWRSTDVRLAFKKTGTGVRYTLHSIAVFLAADES